MITALAELVQTNKNPLIVTHKSPDGDAIGSSVAWCFFLKNCGANPTVLLPDLPPEFLLPFLDGITYLVYEQLDGGLNVNEHDILYCLDFNGTSRVGAKTEVIIEQFQGKKVMIDHHPHPTDFADVQISRPQVCSTAEMVFQLIEEMNMLHHLDLAVAKGIYLGIMTDTGSFRFPSVTADTHRCLSYLLGLGLEHFKIHEAIYDVNTMDRLKLRGYAIAEKAVMVPDSPLAWLALTKEELKRFNYKKGDTEGLVNVLLSIEGIDIGVFFMEIDDEVKLSFRSKGKYFVNQFANKYFNGGGHQYAAGGKSDLSLEETLAKFQSLLPELINQDN
ncbi:MAG: hypothetical protein RL264_1098 [Bacteroidota bacterium]|jgi:phosphoesterase RecJ-like protein